MIGIGGTLDRAFLEDVARATGGAFLETPDSSGVGALYDQLSRLLRSQYVVGIHSTASPDIESRVLRLTIRTPSGETQTQLAYKSRRTITPEPQVEPPLIELPLPVATPGNSNSGPIFVIVALMAAGMTFVSVRYMLARVRDRRVQAVIAVQSARATGELQSEAAIASATLSQPPDVNESGVFLIIQGPGDDERRFRLEKQPTTIGTSDESHLRLDDAAGKVAEEHARIWSRDGKLMFHQIARSAASLVGGRPVSWVSLENGDEIQIGDYRLRVEMT
jgi:hypothetical protein